MIDFSKIPNRYFLCNKERTYKGWLYKYMSNIDYIKSAITDKTMYLSHPSTFNDPFDGGFTITTDSIGKISCQPSFFGRLCGGFLDGQEQEKLQHLIKINDTPILIADIIRAIASPLNKIKYTLWFICFLMLTNFFARKNNLLNRILTLS